MGGLEKRDAQTGELQQVLTTLDGLPSNFISALCLDSQNGLWIGTSDGLAYYAQGQWQVFNQDNSGLPDNHVNALYLDSQNGLWIGTSGGLAYYAQGQWQVFNQDNSGLPDNEVGAIYSDSQDGLWIGTNYSGKLAYYAQGQWQVFNQDNSGLPADNDGISSLSPDGQGGLWIATWEGGLVHYVQGQWQVFNTDNSSLPNNHVSTLFSDSQGGLWVGTLGGGLAHYAQEQWQVFNQDNSSLPSNTITPILSDNQDGWWIGTGAGLAHLNAQGQWQVFKDNSSLPYIFVSDITTDSQGELWVGTYDGLAHLNAQEQWQVFNTNNSGLPDNAIYTLLPDKGGLWIGTYGGLAYLSAQEQWQVFNQDNSSLPNNQVNSLSQDSQGGLWIGTEEGLAYLSAQEQWQVFNHDNSGLPDNLVKAIRLDSQGVLWVGTKSGGLAQYEQGQWQVFNTDNSGLPNNEVTALFADNQDGLWIRTLEDRWKGRLVHYVQGQWQVFNPDNSGLTDNRISSVLPDSQGGLWIGTDSDELAYLSAQGQWQVFNQDNSNLPSISFYHLISDGQNGLWIGGLGLIHLTFGRQTELCTQTQIDSATCQAIQQGQHAAIIVAAGGAQETNTLWESTESITTRIYRTFYRRGFTKSNLYYLSPKTWADFDGDGYNDRISRLSEDRNLTLDDLTAAFTWAKELGQLDQPLYFFFMDHGGEGKLQLSPTVNLPAAELKALLDDYQNTTGNQLIVVIEACHSGSLLPILTAPNRAVITSAKADEKAYFFEKKGFSRFFTDYLLKGASFYESFILASRDQDQLRGKNLNFQIAGDTGITNQTPQLDDNINGDWLKQVHLNGQFATADATLTVENQTAATTLTVGQSVTLQAQATLTQGTVKRVWAVIRPPAIAPILDTSGTPILAFPRLNLVSSADNSEVWQATWDDAIYNGNYLITFYAEDNEKNIASSEQDTTLMVSGGIEPPTQAQVQINLDKTSYQRGELFQATLTEDLGWGYDLYAAVVLPDGNFFTLNQATNDLRTVNEAKPWYGPRQPHRSLTLFDLTLPTNLPTGQYCLYGILSPEQNDVFETKDQGLWVMGQQCFEVY